MEIFVCARVPPLSSDNISHEIHRMSGRMNTGVFLNRRGESVTFYASV